LFIRRISLMWEAPCGRSEIVEKNTGSEKRAVPWQKNYRYLDGSFSACL